MKKTDPRDSKSKPPRKRAGKTPLTSGTNQATTEDLGRAGLGFAAKE